MNMKIEELVLMPQRTFRRQAAEPEVVAEYSALMSAGAKFPALTVAEIGKTKKRVLVGGAHRLAAAVKARIPSLEVTLVKCKGAFEAELLTFSDNSSHGLSLTVEEKRAAIIGILQTPAGSKLSNTKAAVALGVSDMTIKRYRDAIGTKSPKAANNGHKNKSNVEPKVDKGGKVVVAQGDPVVWKIQGAMLGGGVAKACDAIVAKVTEGVSAKSELAWHQRVTFLENLAANIQAFCDASKKQAADE
jgi:hypothetical protein